MRHIALVVTFAFAAVACSLVALGPADAQAPKAKESKMKLESPAFKAGATRQEIETALKGRILAQTTLTGTYEVK
jgi:hypothetical protein